MKVIPFTTDYATVVAFDAELLQGRIRQPESWWRQPLAEVSEAAAGQIALLPIGKEGSYRVSLRVGELSESESKFAVGSTAGCGIEVRSGLVFVGSAERLPGDGRGERISFIPDTGDQVEIPEGLYEVETWVLNWRDEDAFYDEDGEIKSDAPADFVLLLSSRGEETFSLGENTPLLELLPKHEAKGKAKVVIQPKRRRSTTSTSTSSGRRSKSAEDSRGPVEATPPPRVPEQIAPMSGELVRASFREVLYGNLLHPPKGTPLEMILFKPRESGIMAHDITMETLQKKVTRARDQLRVLEAKVNANQALSFGERAELETPITRAYESLDALLGGLSVRLKPKP
jgi:hypothetical protein